MVVGTCAIFAHAIYGNPHYNCMKHGAIFAV